MASGMQAPFFFRIALTLKFFSRETEANTDAIVGIGE